KQVSRGETAGVTETQVFLFSMCSSRQGLCTPEKRQPQRNQWRFSSGSRRNIPVPFLGILDCYSMQCGFKGGKVTGRYRQRRHIQGGALPFHCPRRSRLAFCTPRRCTMVPNLASPLMASQPG